MEDRIKKAPSMCPLYVPTLTTLDLSEIESVKETFKHSCLCIIYFSLTDTDSRQTTSVQLEQILK